MKQSIVVRVEVFREGDLYVGVCPELNVSSFGEMVDEARRSLREALEAFFEECGSKGHPGRGAGRGRLCQTEQPLAATPTGGSGAGHRQLGTTLAAGKITPVHYQTLVRVFELDGFAVKRKKGDHLILTKPGAKRPLVIKAS